MAMEEKRVDFEEEKEQERRRRTFDPVEHVAKGRGSKEVAT